LKLRTASACRESDSEMDMDAYLAIGRQEGTFM